MIIMRKIKAVLMVIAVAFSIQGVISLGTIPVLHFKWDNVLLGAYSYLYVFPFIAVAIISILAGFIFCIRKMVVVSGVLVYFLRYWISMVLFPPYSKLSSSVFLSDSLKLLILAIAAIPLSYFLVRLGEYLRCRCINTP